MSTASLKKVLATESNMFTLDALPTFYPRKKFHMVESCKIVACFWIRSQGWPPLQTGLVTQSYPWFSGEGCGRGYNIEVTFFPGYQVLKQTWRNSNLWQGGWSEKHISQVGGTVYEEILQIL